MIHSNPVKLQNGTLVVDRKFLTGMLKYVELIDEPLTTVHPALKEGEKIMDPVEVRYDGLGFEVEVVDGTQNAKSIHDQLSALIARSKWVYGYTNWGATKIAAHLGIPYTLILECDLKTNISVNINQVTNPLRRAVRAWRSVWQYATIGIPAMRGAAALHCNGFPIYEEAKPFNKNRVLYLDSRMSAEMTIPAQQLEARLAKLGSRPLQLLFSGRYEPIKGALDAVQVAVACIRHGMDIELHCYGMGSLHDAMLELAQKKEVANRIHIHQAIPYPELVQRSYDFDVFVCCHTQNDPSCTYLEAFGAGLPIVGYANRMWSGLSKESGIGYATPLGHTADVVASVSGLISDLEALRHMSRKAREFAVAHTFEAEFKKRAHDIRANLPA